VKGPGPSKLALKRRELMFSRIVEGDMFMSPFTGTTFKVKKIYRNTVLLEDLGDRDHQLIAEIASVGRFYQKVGKRSSNFLVGETK
jgi:hypothetical protein